MKLLSSHLGTPAFYINQSQKIVAHKTVKTTLSLGEKDDQN